MLVSAAGAILSGSAFRLLDHKDRKLGKMLRKLALVLIRTCGVDDDRHCSQLAGRCTWLERWIDTDWRELILLKYGDSVHRLILLYIVKI